VRRWDAATGALVTEAFEPLANRAKGPSPLGLAVVGRVLLAPRGRAFCALDLDTAETCALAPPHHAGHVRAVAVGAGRVFAADDRGGLAAWLPGAEDAPAGAGVAITVENAPERDDLDALRREIADAARAAAADRAAPPERPPDDGDGAARRRRRKRRREPFVPAADRIQRAQGSPD